MEFRHKAIWGMTTMGKTWLMKRIIAWLLKHKQKCIVYAGNGDYTFPKGCILTDDVDLLEEILNNPENFKAFVFIDEAANLYDQINKKKHKLLTGATMRGRHKGYTFYFASQYPTSIPTYIRRGCAEVYCFRLADEDSADRVYRDCNSAHYNGQKIKDQILGLNKLEFFHYKAPNYIEKKEL